MIQAIRSYLINKHYLEVETPFLIPAPAPEVHIDAMTCGAGYLHTSPELCMKRLLAAGYPRLFQICKCFRSHERGSRHLPEFTMLEWYQAGIDYGKLMRECEEMLCWLFGELGYDNTLSYQGRAIQVRPPWPRVTVEDAFALYAPLSLAQALEADCFDEVMAEQIEPNLGLTEPLFIYDFPVHAGALARAKKDAPAVVERFELYLGGLELANAFTELTDAGEQRARFQDAARIRHSLGKNVYPLPERFLDALAAMPEAAGIALGIDRLAMLVTDSPTIDEVVTFVPETL